MTELKNKQCPICGEYIPFASQECEYCGEKFIQDEISEQDTVNEASPTVANMEAADSENEQLEEFSNDESKPKIKLVLSFLIMIVVFAAAIFLVLAKIHDGINLSFGGSSKVIHKQSIPKSISVGTKSNKNVDKARELYKDKKTDEAAELFQAEIDSNNNPVANYYMGEIYNDQGYKKIAISYYKAADSTKKNFYEPKKRLAQIYWENNENDLALEYAQAALKIKQNDIELLKTLASMYEYMNENDKLVEIYKRILKIEPKNYDANYYMANYFYKKDEYKMAATYLSNILSDHYDTNIAYGLVVCYMKVEYYTKAIEVLNKIIANDSYEYYSATNLKNRLIELRDGYNREHGRQPVSDLEERVENALF